MCFSIVPAIWLLELKTNRREMLCLYVEMLNATSHLTSTSQGQMDDSERVRSNILLDIMQVTNISTALARTM